MKVESTLRRALAAFALALASLAIPAHAQKAYPTPMAAAEALVDGIARHDDAVIRSSLGADWAKVLPFRASDADVTNFLAGWAKYRGIAQRDERTAFLEIGESRWSAPVPIVKRKDGWAFDPRGAADEMRTRRIGRNELAAMKVSLAYTDAQEEYYAVDRDGDGTKAFAARVFSTKGKHDGLYWPTLPREKPSPLGPMLAEAKPGQAYYGYQYRILTAQGANAPGGAKSYFRNGKLTEGFALVAWPDKYGDTGVMSFIVSRDAVVYEKDLGPNTASIARAMKAYDPDATWTKSVIVD
jgi:hypothetical protein